MLRTLAGSLFFIAAIIFEANAQKVGDWTMDSESAEGRTAPTATTPGSRPETQLRILQCDDYEVLFQLIDDRRFGAEELPDIGDPASDPPPGTKMIYRWHEGSNPRLNTLPEPVILLNGYEPWYLSLSISGARLAKSIRFCPTAKSADDRCLRFSLIGFSEALRRVCASQRRTSSKR